MAQPAPHKLRRARLDSRQRGADPRRALGQLGENLAADHLERRGFAILDRNVRTRRGEIDIIVFDGVTLAFVEVKTRRLSIRAGCGTTGTIPLAKARGASPVGPTPHSPLDGLRSAQRLRQRRLASAWLQEHAPAPRPRDLRFDAIGVVVDEGGRLLRLEHVEGAW